MGDEQDRLLSGYAKKEGGLIYPERSVGKRLRRGKRHFGERRSIDGVRIIPAENPIGKVKSFDGNQKEFDALIEGKTVEAIEVDEDLNRWVIGQAITGKVMLEIQCGVYAAIPVVVCRVRDELLEQVCARLGVKVWTQKDGFVVPVASTRKKAAA